MNTVNCCFSDDIVCEKAKEEFDDELEEGEIVDDDSDCEHEKFENVELFREAVIYNYYKHGSIKITIKFY